MYKIKINNNNDLIKIKRGKFVFSLQLFYKNKVVGETVFVRRKNKDFKKFLEIDIFIKEKHRGKWINPYSLFKIKKETLKICKNLGFNVLLTTMNNDKSYGFLKLYGFVPYNINDKTFIRRI